MKTLLDQHMLVGEVENAIQMRLYTMSKRRFAVISFLFLISCGSVVVVSIFGPTVLTTQVFDAAEMFSDAKMLNDTWQSSEMRAKLAGPYLWVTPELNVFEQNLWVSARFEPSTSDLMNGISMTRKITFYLRVFGVPHAVVRRIVLLKGRPNADALALNELGKLIEFSMKQEINQADGQSDSELTSSDGERVTESAPTSSPTSESYGWVETVREVHCVSDICDPIPIVHLHPLSVPHYAIQLRFDFGGASYQPARAQFMVNTNNATYTQSVIAFRCAFAVITFIVLCIYLQKLMRYRLALWTYEQKWLLVLLVALFFFDNPFYAFTILPMAVNGLVACTFELFVQTSFAFSLLLFWLCVMHAIRQVRRPLCRFYVPKVLLVSSITFLLFANAVYDLLESNRKPTFNYYFDAKELAFAVRTALLVLLGLYLAYLIFLVVRAYTELRMLPYFNLRLRFSIVLIVLLGVLLTITLVVIRFDRSGKPQWLWTRYSSVSAAAEDDDEANWELSFFTQNAAASFLNIVGFSHFSQLASFYALLNLYLVLLAHCYLPHSPSSEDSNTQSAYYNDELRFYDLDNSELLNGDEDEDEDIMFDRGSSSQSIVGSRSSNKTYGRRISSAS